MFFSKRKFLQSGLASVLFLGGGVRMAAARGDFIDLSWSDLIPDGDGGTQLDALRELGIVQHGQMSTPFDQELSGAVTDEFNGKLVRLPGYMVPLRFDGTGVTEALLVPYVGACIHVPPPPPNQLVFVAMETPYESKGLFEAVNVTGTFDSASTQTELAEVGYSLTADLVEPYG